MNDDNDEFPTNSSPGTPAFERTVDDAVAFFEEAIATEGGFYGARTDATLRSAVRTALETEGIASAEQVADELSDQAVRSTDVEPILRRLEAMVEEFTPDSGAKTDGAGS